MAAWDTGQVLFLWLGSPSINSHHSEMKSWSSSYRCTCQANPFDVYNELVTGHHNEMANTKPHSELEKKSWKCSVYGFAFNNFRFTEKSRFEKIVKMQRFRTVGFLTALVSWEIQGRRKKLVKMFLFEDARQRVTSPKIAILCRNILFQGEIQENLWVLILPRFNIATVFVIRIVIRRMMQTFIDAERRVADLPI